MGKKSRKKDKARREKEAAVDAIVASKETVVEEVAPLVARKTKKKGKSSVKVGEGPVPGKEKSVKKQVLPIEDTVVAGPVEPTPMQQSELVKEEAIGKKKAKAASEETL